MRQDLPLLASEANLSFIHCGTKFIRRYILAILASKNLLRPQDAARASAHFMPACKALSSHYVHNQGGSLRVTYILVVGGKSYAFFYNDHWNDQEPGHPCWDQA